MDINENLRRMTCGACCGIAATVPMSVAMLVIQRLLPASDREPMEPLQVSNAIMDTLIPTTNESNVRRRLAALAAHFGYGAATGAIYPLVRPAFLRIPAGGASYGAALFALSYAGWLPALDIIPMPNHRPLGRNIMLVVSHITWGITLARLYSVTAQGTNEAIARCT